MSNKVRKKKKHQFPTAYTVIIIVLLLVQILTFFIPSGIMQRLNMINQVKSL